MLAAILSCVTALAGIVMSVLNSRAKIKEMQKNARKQAQADALAHAAAGDPDGAVNDVLGMPDR